MQLRPISRPRCRLNVIAWVWMQTAVASVVSACPLCDTGTGEQVRAGILDGNFVSTLVTVLLPFPILLGVVAMIHFGLPRPRNRTERFKLDGEDQRNDDIDR